MIDENLIERLKQEREENLHMWPRLHNMPAILKCSRARCGNVGIVEAEHDPLITEFQPTNFRDVAAFCSLMLGCEMKWRNMPFLARWST